MLCNIERLLEKFCKDRGVVNGSTIQLRLNTLLACLYVFKRTHSVLPTQNKVSYFHHTKKSSGTLLPNWISYNPLCGVRNSIDTYSILKSYLFLSWLMTFHFLSIHLWNRIVEEGCMRVSWFGRITQFPISDKLLTKWSPIFLFLTFFINKLMGANA